MYSTMRKGISLLTIAALLFAVVVSCFPMTAFAAGAETDSISTGDIGTQDEPSAVIAEDITGDEPVATAQAGVDGINARIGYLRKAFPNGSGFSRDGTIISGSAANHGCSECDIAVVIKNHPRLNTSYLPGYVKPSMTGSQSCVAFARFCFYYIFGLDTANVKSSTTANANQTNLGLRVGDYVWMNGIGHGGIVLSESATSITLMHANYGDKHKVHHSMAFSKSSIGTIYWKKAPSSVYNTVTDPGKPADTTKPTISSVSIGTKESHGFGVKVSASDNVALSKVEVHLSWPYSMGTLTTTKSFALSGKAIANKEFFVYDTGFGGLQKLKIYVKVYDSSGNVATSSTFEYQHANQDKPLKSFAYNGHKYEIYCDMLSWEDAKAKCEEKGGYLATITSQAEYNALTAQLNGITYRDYYMLGGKRESGNANWTWVTGESFSYAPWASGQPNASLNGDRFTALGVSDLKWYGLGALRYAYICEYSAAPTAIKLSTSAATLAVNGTQRLSVTTTPADSIYNGVVWQSNNKSVAVVDNNGLVTAKSSGTAEITCTVSGKSQKCVITVPQSQTPGTGTQPPTGESGSGNGTGKDKHAENIEKVTADKTALTTDAIKGSNSGSGAITTNLSLPTTGTNGSSIAWQSSHPGVVSNSGLVTRPATGQQDVQVTLIATITSGGATESISFTVTIKAEGPVATSVKLAQKNIRLTKGKRVTIGAVVYLSDGSTTTDGLTWRSSNEKVAKVNPTTGEITAAKNLTKNGTATITATVENRQSAKIKVTVLRKSAKAVKPTNVSISGSKKTLKVGKTAQLKAKVSPSTATNAAVIWKSSKPSVLMVDKAGKLTALKKGTAKITLSAGGRKFTVKVTVKK